MVQLGKYLDNDYHRTNQRKADACPYRYTDGQFATDMEVEKPVEVLDPEKAGE